MQIQIESDADDWVDGRLINPAGSDLLQELHAFRVPIEKGRSVVSVPFRLLVAGQDADTMVGIGRDRHRSTQIRITGLALVSEVSRDPGAPVLDPGLQN